MKRNLLVSLVSALVVASASASGAVARVYTTTYSGTVSFGNDLNGLFGLPSSSLSGSAFNVEFTTDDGIVGANQFYYDTSSIIEGYFNSSPTYARLIINGTSMTFGYRRGYQAQDRSATADSFSHYAENAFFYSFGRSNYAYINMSGVGSNFLSSSDWRHLNTSQAARAQDVSGTFNVYAADPDNGVTQSTFGYLMADRVVVSGGVPEPRDWTLFIAGLACVGTLLRHSRRPSARRTL